ncbi:MAG: alpha/beta fold hydrolase [Actinomycetota bacterium]
MKIRQVDLGGPVRYADFGGEGPPIVLVHGLGGAHVNWMAAGPLLAKHGRVVAVDLAGFGLTPRAGRSASVHANARLLGQFLEEVSGTPAIVVGNSMGGMIGILQAAARPERVAGLVLVDPVLPMAGRRPDRLVLMAFAAYAVPGVGERFVRSRVAALGPEGLVRETFRYCCADASSLREDIVRAHIEFARLRERQPWAQRAFLQGARSLVRLVLRPRAYRSVIRRVEAPTLLLHGAQDRLVSLLSARAAARLRPDWTFRVLDGVGHLGELEAPEQFAGAVDSWLDGPGRAALDAASDAGPRAAAG